MAIACTLRAHCTPIAYRAQEPMFAHDKVKDDRLKIE
jgi:hypothetical protein